MKTPKEWAQEWRERCDLAPAEASPSETLEVIVKEAVADERKQMRTFLKRYYPMIDFGLGEAIEMGWHHS